MFFSSAKASVDLRAIQEASGTPMVCYLHEGSTGELQPGTVEAVSTSAQTWKGIRIPQSVS